MPELAEVEMIRRVLEPQLRGRTVTKLSVLRPEVVAHPQAEQFAQEVCGAVSYTHLTLPTILLV